AFVYSLSYCLCFSTQSPCSFSFSIRMPRPLPNSSLFPYTTLFRSRRFAVLILFLCLFGMLAVLLRRGRLPGLASGPVWRLLGTTDRKSTRLNSSHVSISYAVFCLKKKKISFEMCGDGKVLVSSLLE